MINNTTDKAHEVVAKAPKRRLDHHYIDGKYIYHTPAWRSLAKRKRNANPMCEHCAKHMRATPSQMVDHIKPIEHGGEPFDYSNLQALCDR